MAALTGAIAESATIGETSAASATFAVAMAEAGTSADSFAAVTAYLGAVAENVTPADSSVQVVVQGEALTVADTSAATVSFAAAMVESGTVADSAAAMAAFYAARVETVTVTDASRPATAFSASVIEVAAIADAVFSGGTGTVVVRSTGDISTLWDTTRGDWALAGPDLLSGNDIVSAVLISLFTDRQANPDDVIPDGSGDPRGWWGDDGTDLIGSRLWLIERAKKTQETLALAQDYIEEALQWLIADGISSTVDVYVEWTREHTLGAQVTVYRVGNPVPIELATQNVFGIPQIQSWGWNEGAGTGEWKPVVPTVPVPPHFLDTFTGVAGPLSAHTPDLAPAAFAWPDNSPGENLLLDGLGSVHSPSVVYVSTGTAVLALDLGTAYRLGLDVTMDPTGATNSISTVDLTLQDFDTGYALTLYVKRVPGGTFNVGLIGAPSGIALGVAAGGAHSFIVNVSATGCVVQMDGATILTTTGDANLRTSGAITLSITNTDAGRNHTIQRVDVLAS